MHLMRRGAASTMGRHESEWVDQAKSKDPTTAVPMPNTIGAAPNFSLEWPSASEPWRDGATPSSAPAGALQPLGESPDRRKAEPL